MTTSSDVTGEEGAAAMSTLLTKIARVMFQEIKRKAVEGKQSNAAASETVPARQLQRSHVLVIGMRVSCRTKERTRQTACLQGSTTTQCSLVFASA